MTRVPQRRVEDGSSDHELVAHILHAVGHVVHCVAVEKTVSDVLKVLSVVLEKRCTHEVRSTASRVPEVLVNVLVRCVRLVDDELTLKITITHATLELFEPLLPRAGHDHLTCLATNR